MESRVAESTQQMLLPGKCVDLYYPDPQTAEKQCYRTSMNSKFIVAFNTLTAGVNVLTIPPNNGIGDVLVRFTITAPTTTTNVALAAGWGYALMNRLSYRVGGSSQYFLSGAQVLQNALRLCPDGTSRDNIIQLGGPAIATAADWANSNNLTAYCWLSFPWSRPSAVSKPPPLPTDLLTQQVQIQLENFNITSIAAVNGGVTTGLSLSVGNFIVGQVQLQNQGDALARRVDMTTHSLSYPVEFTQQEFGINLGSAASGSSQQVSLTGFRSGEVKSIQMWLTVSNDATGVVNNTNKWYAPQEIVMTYAGDQYARYDSQSSKLWNLINGRLLPVAAASVNQTSGGALVNQPSVTQWAELPFAQSYCPDSAHSMYISGKEITNGIVQVTFNLPAAPDAFSGAAAAGIAAGGSISGNWTLHVSYVYNSVLVFSQGTADFAF
jgi:phage terminase large subunit-like protein